MLRLKNLEVVNGGNPEGLGKRAEARDNRLDDDRLKVDYGKGGFVTAGKRFLVDASKRAMRGESLRLLLWLLGNMKEGNCVRHTQVVIADKLEWKREAVGRALRELREAGYVLVEKAPDGQRVIFVDPRRAFASGGTAQRRATVHYLKAAPSVAVV